MRNMIAALALLSAFAANAQDSRFGFATHFDTVNPLTAMPLIQSSGVAYIRDDINWDNIEHQGPGVYGLYTSKLAWINEAHKRGLKIIADVQAGGGQSSRFYADPFDPVAYPKAAAWLATQKASDGTPLVAAIEVLNEPNNNPFRNYGGTLWREKLTTLTTNTFNAVHTAGATTPVIGLGIQGADIIYCLNHGAKVDGVVFHPYDLNDNVATHNYEPPYNNFKDFVPALRAVTKAALFTTEQNCDNNTSQLGEAIWDAQRLYEAAGLGVEHTFIYDFVNDGSGQGVVNTDLTPRQTYTAIKNVIIPSLHGRRTLGAVVTVSAHDGNWLAADFRGYVFDTGGIHPTVAAVWFGNHSVTTALTPSAATVSFPGTNTHTSGACYIQDVVTGVDTAILEAGQPNPNNQPQWSTTPGQIANVRVSEKPVLVIIK
jgi:hypothetical protein